MMKIKFIFSVILCLWALDFLFGLGGTSFVFNLLNAYFSALTVIICMFFAYIFFIYVVSLGETGISKKKEDTKSRDISESPDYLSHPKDQTIKTWDEDE